MLSFIITTNGQIIRDANGYTIIDANGMVTVVTGFGIDMAVPDGGGLVLSAGSGDFVLPSSGSGQGSEGAVLGPVTLSRGMLTLTSYPVALPTLYPGGIGQNLGTQILVGVQPEVSVTIFGSENAEVLAIGSDNHAIIDGGLGRDVLSIGADDILVRSHDGGYALPDAGSGDTRVTFRGVEVLRTPTGDLSLLPHAADFSATGTDAVLWRHDDGTFWQWSLSGTSIVGGGGQTVGAEWSLLGSGDLYGDGHGSLLWRHAGDGVVWAWHMNGTSIADGGSVAAVDSSWLVVAVADFTGDGRSDILWRHANDGALWLFAMNGTAIGTGSGAVLNPGVPWVPVGAADLNGDGRADLLWRNADTGEFYAWTMDGTAVTAMASLGTPRANGETDWALAGTGDFNGDGQADLLLRSAGSGDLLLWQARPGGGHDELAPDNPGLAWQVASLADVNGDGFTDIVWRNTTTGQPYLWLMQGATILAQGSLPDPGSQWHIVG
jgi:hypothetical protein